MNINLGDGQSRRDSFRVFGSLLYQDSIFTYTHSQTISTVAIYVCIHYDRFSGSISSCKFCTRFLYSIFNISSATRRIPLLNNNINADEGKNGATTSAFKWIKKKFKKRKYSIVLATYLNVVHFVFVASTNFVKEEIYRNVLFLVTRGCNLLR